VVCAALIAATPLAASATDPRAASTIARGQWGACGLERWEVKTLQDRPRLLPTRPAAIATLGADAFTVDGGKALTGKALVALVETTPSRPSAIQLISDALDRDPGLSSATKTAIRAALEPPLPLA
jgi:hypothetical protein